MQLVVIPAQFGNQLGNPKYDWFFPTIPQKHAKDRVNYWSRGRMLGGSTAINFYVHFQDPTFVLWNFVTLTKLVVFNIK